MSNTRLQIKETKIKGQRSTRVGHNLPAPQRVVVATSQSEEEPKAKKEDFGFLTLIIFTRHAYCPVRISIVSQYTR